MVGQSLPSLGVFQPNRCSKIRHSLATATMIGGDSNYPFPLCGFSDPAGVPSKPVHSLATAILIGRARNNTPLVCGFSNPPDALHQLASTYTTGGENNPPSLFGKVFQPNTRPKKLPLFGDIYKERDKNKESSFVPPLTHYGGT